MPPPPPNQIVLVRYPKGIRIDDIYAPLEVDGRLRIEAASNAAADAAYALGAAKVRCWSNPARKLYLSVRPACVPSRLATTMAVFEDEDTP